MSELPKILLILPYKRSCMRVSLEIPLLSLGYDDESDTGDVGTIMGEPCQKQSLAIQPLIIKNY